MAGFQVSIYGRFWVSTEAGMVLVANALSTERAERERQAEEWRRAEERRIELERQRQEEEKRQQRLEQEAAQ